MENIVVDLIKVRYVFSYMYTESVRSVFIGRECCWFPSCCMPRICHSLCVVHEAKLRGKNSETVWHCYCNPVAIECNLIWVCFFLILLECFTSTATRFIHGWILISMLNGKCRVFQRCMAKAKETGKDDFHFHHLVAHQKVDENFIFHSQRAYCTHTHTHNKHWALDAVPTKRYNVKQKRRKEIKRKKLKSKLYATQ